MNSQSEKVSILLCSGGAWELVNGVLEYMPLELMKREVALPLGITQSSLVNLVARKLSLVDTCSGFRLSYRLPPHGDVVELVDDDDFSVLMDVVFQMSPETVTLFVVESVSSGGNRSDVGFNQAGSFFPGTTTPNTYQNFETQRIDVQTTQKYKPQLVPKHEPTYVVDISDEMDDGVELDKENDVKENVKVGRDCLPPPLPTPVVPFITPKAPICSEPTSHIKFGQLYNTKKDLKLALRSKCLKEGFQIRITRSSKDRFEAVCLSGKCEWRIRAVLVKGIDAFHVRKLEDRHTCLRT